MPVRRARHAGGEARQAALSGRRQADRGRLAAVPHAGARFDVAYFSLFKCNRQQLRISQLWAYTRDLYAYPGVAETVKPRLYVQNYYSLWVNPNGIIPKGTPVDFSHP